MVPFCHDRLRLAVRVRELGLEEDALAHLQVLARCAQLSDCLCREVCLEHVEKMRAAGAKAATAAANGQPVPFCKRLNS